MRSAVNIVSGAEATEGGGRGGEGEASFLVLFTHGIRGGSSMPRVLVKDDIDDTIISTFLLDN